MTDQIKKKSTASRRGKNAAPKKKTAKAGRAAKGHKSERADAPVLADHTKTAMPGGTALAKSISKAKPAAKSAPDAKADTASASPAGKKHKARSKRPAPGLDAPSDAAHQAQTASETYTDGADKAAADPDALAIRFLELWRAQVAATAGGSDAASAIGRLYAGLGADTSRLAEGFEAWGRLIGQLATGQPPVQNPLAPGPGRTGQPVGMNTMFDPVRAMMNFKPPFATGTATSSASATSSAPAAPSENTPATGAKKSADKTSSRPDIATTTDQKTETVSSEGGEKTAPVTYDGEENGREQSQPAASGRTPGGAKATGDASGRRDDELAELTRRLAALSETIDALEAGIDDGSGKPASGDVPPQQ